MRAAFRPHLQERASCKRGTLAEQLAGITSCLDGVTCSLLKRAAPPPPHRQEADAPGARLLTIPALQMRVGRVVARRGAPVALHCDRATFTFAHRETEVAMTMWFKDIAPCVRVSGPAVTFRVRGDNMRAFEEGTAVTNHCVTLTFSDASAATRFVAAVKGSG